MRILDDGINASRDGAASSPRQGTGTQQPDHVQAVTGSVSDFDAQVAEATIDEVLRKIDGGEWDADEVLAAERRGKSRAGIEDELGDGRGTDDDD